MDEDTITDDLVGSATVDLSKYTNSPGEHKCIIFIIVFRICEFGL